MTSEIKDSFWFSQLENPYPVGIVLVYDPITHENKAYIGRGFGLKERVDIEHVLKWGSPLPEAIARKLFRHLNTQPPPPSEQDKTIEIIADLLMLIYSYQETLKGWDVSGEQSPTVDRALAWLKEKRPEK